ncbi:hypothetical protein BH18THE1_BH18THE1_12460 [soil metagenome]
MKDIISFKYVLVNISNCYFIVEDYKIDKVMILTSNNLSNSRFLCLLYLRDYIYEVNVQSTKEKEISTLL